ncbi:MAG: hypothetical protein ACOC8B_04075 [Gemmatimonadota bacterium]
MLVDRKRSFIERAVRPPDDGHEDVPCRPAPACDQMAHGRRKLVQDGLTGATARAGKHIGAQQAEQPVGTARQIRRRPGRGIGLEGSASPARGAEHDVSGRIRPRLQAARQR